MSKELEKIKTELMSLPKEARASLAKTLIESLDDTIESNVNELWEEEIKKRDAEIKTGKVKTKSAEEVLKSANERLKYSK